jgi:stage III sporulation protein AG
MDVESGREKLVAYIKKFQYILIILAVGILIMLTPEGDSVQPEIITAEVSDELDLEETLEEVISQISGVGKTEVLLTESHGRETVYQTDNGYNTSGNDTVILTDSNRNQYGLVRQILPPVYKGAVVVCKGADSASVRLAVVDAVMRATGLSSDRITVLKMK